MSRGCAPSRAATGSTTTHPSARASVRGPRAPRRGGCSSRSARRQHRRAGPGRRASSTKGAAGRTASGRSARSAPPPVRIPQAASLCLEHAVHHGRVLDQEVLDRRARQDEAAEGPHGDDIGNGRLTQEDRELPEEVAPTEARPPCPSMTTRASPSRMTWKADPDMPWRRTRSPSPCHCSSKVLAIACPSGSVG